LKKLYTHENRLLVFNIKNLLEEEGIDCSIRNEFASSGVGDLSPFETWPEVWITDDSQWARAELIIMQLINDQSPTYEWTCTHCHEVNESNFSICWNCLQPGKISSRHDLL
jgi:hypothetical protein